MIAAPPLDEGALKVTEAFVVDIAVADTIPGAEGGAAGVVIVEPAVVGEPSPTALIADTAILY